MNLEQGGKKHPKYIEFILSLCISQHNFDVKTISLEDDTSFILPY